MVNSAVFDTFTGFVMNRNFQNLEKTASLFRWQYSMYLKSIPLFQTAAFSKLPRW